MSSSADSSGESDDPSAVQSIKRGITKMKSVVRMKNSGKKYPVQWNDKNQPIGDYSSKLMSYVGHCTRNRVSISYSSWWLVPKEIKHMLAEQVMNAFDLPTSRSRWIIQVASHRFREFKNRLARLYLYKGNPEDGVICTDPPSVYEFITQEDWNEFVAQRETPQFKELSAKNSQLAKLNKYPHRTSRKGYAGIEQDIIKEKNLEPSTRISRGELWKAARLDIDGDICNKEVKDIFNKIDDLNEQVSSGKLKISGRRDTLSLALGKDDHPGRVIGVGKGVTKKQYWPDAHDRVFLEESSKPSFVAELQAELQELRRIVKVLADDRNVNIKPIEPVFSKKVLAEDAHEEVLDKNGTIKDTSLQENMSKEVLLKETIHTPNEAPVKHILGKEVQEKENLKKKNLDKGSHSAVRTHAINLEGWSKCQLFWPNLKTHVATGSMFMQCSNVPILLHCKPLSSQFAKVIIETALLETSSLPVPIGEASTVKEAVGIPIAWPKSNILPLKTSVPLMKSKNSATSTSKHSICQSEAVGSPPVQPSYRSLKKMTKLLPLLDSQGSLASIVMQVDILGYAHEISIWKADIERWMLKKRIESTHISLYMKYLFETKCVKNIDMFHFLCPQWICSSQENGLKKNERANYISTSMVKKSSHQKLVFTPYNSNGHWMLGVIYPRANTVYWLDPLHGIVKDDFKEVIEMAITLYYAELKERKVQQKTRWLLIEYFAGSPSSYTPDQVDEIREEWIEFVEKYIDW